MGNIKRIKSEAELRRDIEEIYDKHGDDKRLETLWPKFNYDMAKAKEMRDKEPSPIVSLEKKKAFIDEIIRIFNEVCQNENVTINSIEENYYGTLSRIFFVGDKVIKLGGYRETSIIPNNLFIIRPLLRTYMQVEEGNDRGLFIEVTQRVDTSTYIPKEELYKIYAGLRDVGIEWSDVRPSNVGILLEDNVIHWNGELNLFPSSIMVEGEITGEPLKKGDYVVFDNDGLYRGKAPDEYVNRITGYSSNCVLEYRNLYELEHTKKTSGLKLFPQAIKKSLNNFQKEDKKKK